MIKSWDEEAWADYVWYQTNDKVILKKVNNLIKDIERNGYANAEPLKRDLAEFYSRRIDRKNRLVFKIEANQKEIFILQCRTHYGD